MSSQSSSHLQKKFSSAVSYLQAGNFNAASKQFLKLSKQIPHSAVVWYNLGLCQQNLEKHTKAIDAYTQCLKITPENVEAWINLGISYKEIFNLPKSEDAITQALKLAPNHSRALNLLGSMLAEKGEIQPARKHLNRALSNEPSNKDTRINLANLEFDDNQLEESERITDGLLRDYPDEKKVKLLKARLLNSAKNYEEASPLVAELEATSPNDVEVMRLGLSFREAIRDHFGAIDICEKILKQFPDDAPIWNSMAGAYFQLDGIHKAKEYYSKAVSLKPENAEYENNLGLVYSSLGDKENAEKHYRISIELDSQYGEAYRHIAAMKKFESLEDPDALEVIKLWENEDINDFTRIKASFALGKIYDDCGEHDKAFKVYSVGNELKFKDSQLDLDSFLAHIDRIPQVFSKRPEILNQTESSITPIFILGMPRSGTTLVEQIISRHSQVYGCGELPCIERAIARLEKKATPIRMYPEEFLGIEEHEFEREAKEYISWVKRLRTISTPYLTDKMPFNFTHVWLIKAMFPKSVIVNCQRHPLDIITSNYFQLYGSDISFVYNLTALANYYIRYHRMMIHWKSLFGDEVYNAVYEAIVSDVENETRKLIDAVNLPWEDNCLDQNQSDTTVRTASIWQVRQGIYTSSTERWKKYESYLGEVIEILAEEGILDSAGNRIVRA
jgi:tetratricopeptide (TPR) repeat protein